MSRQPIRSAEAVRRAHGGSHWSHRPGAPFGCGTSRLVDQHASGAPLRDRLADIDVKLDESAAFSGAHKRSAPVEPLERPSHLLGSAQTKIAGSPWRPEGIAECGLLVNVRQRRVEAILGRPLSKKRTAGRGIFLDYPNLTLLFENDRLVEATAGRDP